MDDDAASFLRRAGGLKVAEGVVRERTSAW